MLRRWLSAAFLAGFGRFTAVVQRWAASLIGFRSFGLGLRKGSMSAPSGLSGSGAIIAALGAGSAEVLALS